MWLFRVSLRPAEGDGAEIGKTMHTDICLRTQESEPGTWYFFFSAFNIACFTALHKKNQVCRRLIDKHSAC